MAGVDWDRRAVLDMIVDGTGWMTEELRPDTLLVDVGLAEDDVLALAEELGDEFDVEFGDGVPATWITVGDVLRAGAVTEAVGAPEDGDDGA